MEIGLDEFVGTSEGLKAASAEWRRVFPRKKLPSPKARRQWYVKHIKAEGANMLVRATRWFAFMVAQLGEGRQLDKMRLNPSMTNYSLTHQRLIEKNIAINARSEVEAK